jgi:hypothetical protein
LRLIEENGRATAQELQEMILKAAGEFSEGHWYDDATVLVISVQ